jgi:shikimate dehydrogenase
MQNAALRFHGIAGRYLPFEIAPDALLHVLRSLVPLGFRGLNVTIPYKEAVVRHLDRVDQAASAIGAVNTIVVRDGRLEGHNTDGGGFLRALREGAARGPRGASVLLLGAGGAARAIAFACIGGGCRELVVANRTPARARALCRSILRAFPAAPLAASGLSGRRFARAAASASIVVNTTPLGRLPGDPLPMPAELLRPGQVVMDIVYRPATTRFLAAAAAAGALPVGGLGMLLHQGALAFRLWTGRKAPIAVMRRALRAACRAS